MSPTGGGWDTGKVPLELCPDPSAHNSAHNLAALDAAWFALGRDFTYTGPHDPETAHAIVARHRPLIEAALRKVLTELIQTWRERASTSFHAHAWSDAVTELEAALLEPSL